MENTMKLNSENLDQVVGGVGSLGLSEIVEEVEDNVKVPKLTETAESKAINATINATPEVEKWSETARSKVITGTVAIVKKIYDFSIDAPLVK